MSRETVSDILKKVFAGSNFKCLEFEKRAVETDGASEYSDHDVRIKGEIFESPKLSVFRDVRTPSITEATPSIIAYFMDGSRRVFRFSDIILENGKYFPVLAGQTGVAVLRRGADGEVFPVQKYSRWENILVLPDAVERDDRKAIEDALKKSGRFSFTVTEYPTGKSGGNQSEDYITSATKRVLDKMHDNEVWAVKEMMKDCVLSDGAMLLIDGSLQFRSDVLKRNDFQVNQLINVIGVSKSFTPSQPVHGMKGGRHLGSVLQDMQFGQRTPVFKAGYGDFEKVLGVWYLRLRDRGQMTNPLAGILKLEVLAHGVEEEDGLDGHRVDALSAMVLSERNVTPFGDDERWANHLYPVYLTEKYLKSRFLSDVYFKGLL